MTIITGFRIVTFKIGLALTNEVDLNRMCPSQLVGAVHTRPFVFIGFSSKLNILTCHMAFATFPVLTLEVIVC